MEFAIKFTPEHSLQISLTLGLWTLLLIAAILALLFYIRRRMLNVPKYKNKEVKANLKLGVISVEGTWMPDESERKAAWELYAELVTRIAVIELKDEEGLIREALNSLHSIFDTTRKILRNYGPSIAQPRGKDKLSFGFIAISVLNHVLRPFLAKWHPVLLDYENKRDTGKVSQMEHERAWDRNKEIRDEMRIIRGKMSLYADFLAELSQVPPLTKKSE